MINKVYFKMQQALPITIGMCLFVMLMGGQSVSALTPLPNPNPKPGSYGLEATKTKAPPTQGATITTPGGGASFNKSPITVNGICPNDLLVQVYNNGVMVGSTMCKNGSFSVEISLFAGINELSAIVYDELDQAGPVSNIVTVNFTDTNFTAFGSLVTLTSSYGRRSAAATRPLDWPLQLSGGAGPYAFSIDWGDGTPTELKSQGVTGVVTIAHTYKKAGVYAVNIKVTDVNGVSAFLQVIALGNGKVDAAQTPETTQVASPPQILWIPTAVSLLLLIPSYWLGRRSQLTSLRNKMLKERDSFEQK
jgi:hypothetical protein